MNERLNKLYNVSPAGEIESGTYFDGDQAGYVELKGHTIGLDGHFTEEHIQYFAELMAWKAKERTAYSQGQSEWMNHAGPITFSAEVRLPLPPDSALPNVQADS